MIMSISRVKINRYAEELFEVSYMDSIGSIDEERVKLVRFLDDLTDCLTRLKIQNISNEIGICTLQVGHAQN